MNANCTTSPRSVLSTPIQTPQGSRTRSQQTTIGLSSSSPMVISMASLTNLLCSIRCVEIIAGVLGRAGEAGQARRLEDAKLGISTWLPTEGLGLPYDGDEEKKKEAE